MDMIKGIHEEQDRCRELLKTYEELSKLPNVITGFAIAGIKAEIEEGNRAIESGDVARMVRAYAALKGCE